MAIVSNWTDPLKDSILKLLFKSGLTYLEFEKIRQAALLLDGSPVSEELAQSIAQKLEKFEQQYQSALEKLGSDSISIVENGIQELTPLEGYKDCSQKIAEGRANVERLKQAAAERERRKRKRNILIGLAAALVVVLCVVVLILNTRAEQRRIRAAIADAQAMVDAGQYEDAVTALIALTEADSTGSQYPELYPVADAALERVSSEDDEELLAKGWELLLMLDERQHSVPSEAEIAEAYLLSLPGEDVGEAAIIAVENDYLESDDPTVIQAMEHALDALPPSGAWDLAQRASGLILARDSASMSRAFEKYVDSLDSAMAWTVVYDALVDEKLSIEDGLLSRVFEAHVQNLSLEDALLELQGYEDDGTLNALPAEIVAQIEGRRLHAAAEELAPNATQAQVEEWAKTQLTWLVETPSDPDAALQLVYDLNDAGYDVSAIFPDGIPISIPIASRINAMTAALVDGNMPEDFPDLIAVLPISIEEQGFVEDSTSSFLGYSSESRLDSMIAEWQQDDQHYDVRLLPEDLLHLPEDMRPETYAQCKSLLCMQNMYFYTSVIEQTSSTSLNYPTINSSKSYFPIFSAVDMVSIYDLTDVNCFYYDWIQVNPAQAEDNVWFQINKNSTTVRSAQYRVGSFDREATKEAFGEMIDNLDILRLLSILNI